MKNSIKNLPLSSFAAVLLATMALAVPTLAFAQQPAAAPAPAQQSFRIDRITVRGNVRIEASTVISYLPILAGQTVTDEQINEAIRTLAESGLFANVSMVGQNNELIIEVVENPIINRVVFEGNEALNEEDLLDEISARPRGIFTRARVQQDVQRIIENYRRSGRISASVTPKVIELPQSRVDLIFEINEGPKSGILDVNFLGNETYSDRELQEIIVTQRSSWYKFFSTNDNYDPDRVEVDVARLQEFYRNQGYFDFSVVSSVAELRPDRNAFVLTFTIAEGEQYKFGDLTVDTELNRLDPNILTRLLPMQKGDIYSNTAIENATDALIFAAGRAGFAFVDVEPRLAPKEDGTLDVAFHVTEGPRVYIERIDIVGNNQTLDRVIRREMELAEGDAYNRVLVDRSLSNLRGLGFFADVKIEDSPGSAPDRTALTVGIQEQPTGELSFSAGYSSIDQLVIDARVAQRNFRGRGQNVVAQIRTGSFQQNISFSFTEPKFQGRDLGVGFDVYAFRYDFSRQANYETTQTGARVFASFPLSENSYLSLRYNLRNDSIQVPSGSCSVVAQPVLCAQLGDRITSLAGLTWSLDRRDSAGRPHRGYRLLVSQDLAGLGGETRYMRTELEGSWYHTFTPSLILSTTGSAGYVDGYGGRPVRINDRFFKGGTSFRGFETAGLGPRDIAFNSALGGKAFAIGSVELTIPTFLPEQFGINASLFTDFGTLTGIEAEDKVNCSATTPPICTPSIAVKDSGSLRATYGISIGWNSPLGPIQFDFSEILAAETYDLTEGFRFSSVRRF